MTVSDAKKENWKFKLSNLDAFKAVCDELNVRIETSDNMSCLSRPVRAGVLEMPNALAVHPMEGADGDTQGRPGPLTCRRYERFAAGGAGLLWAEAIAVVPEGRANPRQLWLHEDSKSAFAEMARRMRQAAVESMGKEHSPIIVAQLTHSGRYSKPDGVARPLIPQRDPYRDPLTPEKTPTPWRPGKVTDDCVVSDDYLDHLQQSYVAAAKLAFEAGFDAIDLKSCHGYLVNELLASRNRPGKYGGSFENRTRFILETIDRIQAESGKDTPISLRLGFYDAIPFPYGWGVSETDYTKPDLTEPQKLVSLLQAKGVRLINFTIANPYYNPHVGRPFNQAIKGAYDEPEHPLRGVERLINLAAQVQREFPEIAFVGTGYSWLRQLMGPVAAASVANGKSRLIGGGRMALAYPDFAKDLIQKGTLDPNKVCIGCSACTQLMRDGQTAGCVIRDNKIYGPIFKRGRMTDRTNLQRLAQQCLGCQEPTCQLGCPAGIEIPVFIQQFLCGDDEGAYRTIRKANVFPEVCAWLCPVEQQCQGACLQKYIGDEALPIADIQRYLAEQANRNGWSKLAIPQKATGRKIAVVGAGPAGLSAAAVLLEAGHHITLLDKHNRLGGMIDAVIPSDRQNRALNNEISAVFQGVPGDRFEIRNRGLDEQYTLDNLFNEGFDAVFIGMGLQQGTSVGSEKLDGLYDALTFLQQSKQPGGINLSGKSVAVIGGGNTAMDAAVSAKHDGAQDVYVLYRRSFDQMPAWPVERDRAAAEGVHFLVLTQPTGYLSNSGKITGLKLCPCRLGEPDASGRRKPVCLRDSTYEMAFDVVIEAVGQQADDNLAATLPGVRIASGLISTPPHSCQTSRNKVFAGGDIVRGAATVVAAVADGMKAAKEIHEALK